MSFEIVDNFLQVGVLSMAALASMALSLRRRSRRLVLLAFAYASFAMGTLYYALFIGITGSVPRVFYVSEISWIASWLFCLSLQILRMEETGTRPSLRSPGQLAAPALCALCVMTTVVASQMMGPSWLVCGLFAATLGASTYLSVLHLRQARGRRLDLCLLLCVVLQLCVYVSSDYVRDYTRFNPYFAFDLALTVCLVTLLPQVLREEARAA